MDPKRLHHDLRDQNARDAAEAERRGLALGKEPFDWAELRELAGIESSSAEREQYHKYHYYTSEFEILDDYARFLREIEPWSDSS